MRRRRELLFAAMPYWCAAPQLAVSEKTTNHPQSTAGVDLVAAHPTLPPNGCARPEQPLPTAGPFRQNPLLRSLGHGERFRELLSILFDPGCCPAFSFRDLLPAHLASQLLPFTPADFDYLN